MSNRDNFRLPNPLVGLGLSPGATGALNENGWCQFAALAAP